MQSIIYVVLESLEKRNEHKFDHELITMADGGTCGVDWEYDSEGRGRPEEGDDRPVLLLYPGLSGPNDSLYTVGVTMEA
jgi:predicted alpha/beta-fold hydrolase